MEWFFNLIISNPIPIVLWIAVGIVSYHVYIYEDLKKKSGIVPKVLFVLISPVITIPFFIITLFKS